MTYCDITHYQDNITSLLDTLTGCPSNDDILLFAVPVCAPYMALNQYKYVIGCVTSYVTNCVTTHVTVCVTSHIFVFCHWLCTYIISSITSSVSPIWVDISCHI